MIPCKLDFMNSKILVKEANFWYSESLTRLVSNVLVHLIRWDISSCLKLDSLVSNLLTRIVLVQQIIIMAQQLYIYFFKFPMIIFSNSLFFPLF